MFNGLTFILLICCLSIGHKTFKTHKTFFAWKVANRLLSNGKRLRAVDCFIIDIQKVLHCFVGFVIKTIHSAATSLDSP